MASHSLAFLFFLSFLSFATAAPWIVTEYYEEIVTVESGYTDDYYGFTESAATYTEIFTVPSPTGIPLATSTVTQLDDIDNPVTLVQVLYPSQAAAQTATVTADSYGGYGDDIYTYYVVALTYTAPSDCSSSWNYTTAATVYPPVHVEPTSTSISFSTDNSRPFQPTTVTQVYAYLDPTQVPTASLSKLRESYSPYPSCYNPEATGSASSSSSSSHYCDYNDCNSDWINDSYWYGISPLAIILIVCLGWTFLIFVAGLFENYFHFQRLMKGWQARRGLPVTWWFWIFPCTTLLFLFLSRKGFQARSAEDAEVLKRRWEEMGFWKRKRLWLRHGFTMGYPSILLLDKASPPPRVGRPSPRPVPTQPLLQVSTPAESAVASVRSSHSEERPVHSHPEMSGGLPPLTASSSLQVPGTGPGSGSGSVPEHHVEAAEHADHNQEIQPRPSSEIQSETRPEDR